MPELPPRKTVRHTTPSTVFPAPEPEPRERGYPLNPPYRRSPVITTTCMGSGMWARTLLAKDGERASMGVWTICHAAIAIPEHLC